MKQLSSLLIAFFILVTLSAQDTINPPNIVLLLVDDAALMDFGVYGGEAATPNIDKLAHQGMLFTNFHASPMCAPSRAMLMTGCDSHLTGVPNLPIFLPPDYISKPGYEGILNNKVKTVARHLKDNGYNTYMTGKWHLGHTETTLPSKRGFDRTFILDASGADNYEQKAYLATQETKPPWFEDGKAVELPDDFYSSKSYVDKMMDFMEEEANKQNPFFAYLAFQAIHIPVQAPKEFVQKYKGIYEGGWDKLRQERYQKAKELELIPADAALANMLPVVKKWDAISEIDKKKASDNMAVNAAMLEAMDYHIGRYLTYLKNKGLLENTVFIVTSDNGPEGSDPSLIPMMEWWIEWNGHHRDADRLGEKGYYGLIGPGFANAAATPSTFFKFYAGEGGLRVPLIFSGKNIPVGKAKAFSFITDIAPTILDIAGVETEAKSSTTPMTGKSLFPVLQDENEQVYEAEEALGMEAAGQAALFKGAFKLVRSGKPYGDGVWRLFNLQEDPGEAKDLAKEKPELFQEMMTDYEAYETKFGVLRMPEGYETVQEIFNKTKRAVLPWLLGFAGLLLSLVVFVWRRRR